MEQMSRIGKSERFWFQNIYFLPSGSVGAPGTLSQGKLTCSLCKHWGNCPLCGIMGHWHLLGTKAKLRLLHTPDSKELKGEIWLSGPVSSHLEEFEMACWLADSLSLLSHTDYTANEFHDWSHCQQKPHRKYDCCMAGVKHFFPSQTSVNEKTTSFNKQGTRGTRQVMTDGTF